jgi:crossover junction endodeoxyribonuclease RuvC
VLFEELGELLRRERPEVLAVETVFHGKSFDSVLKVGEARGVVLLAGALQGMEVHEYTPAMVKKTVTGNGRASKEQVQRMMARLLELERLPGPVDVTDALALAFCHGQRLWRQQLEASGRASRPAREGRRGGDP